MKYLWMGYVIDHLYDVCMK